MSTKSSSGADVHGHAKSGASETTTTGLDVDVERKNETSPLLDVLQYRAPALVYIESLSQLATEGDRYALRYLQQIAEAAVVELEKQSVEGRREVAASVFEWPVLMTVSSAWNRKRLAENLVPLKLGRDCKFLNKVDALAVKGTPLKEIVVRILALLQGLKNEHDAMELCSTIGESIRAEGLGEDAVEYARNLANRLWSQRRRLNTEKIEGICRQLGMTGKSSGIPFVDLSEAARSLPEFDSTKFVQDKWFKSIMAVLEGFTGGRYDKKRYNLQGECGFVLKDEAEAESMQGEIRKELRDRMKKAFDKMLADDIETPGK